MLVRCLEAEGTNSRLQTHALSIIHMREEQNSQYVGMLYWVDLKIWPLCSSTCFKKTIKQNEKMNLLYEFIARPIIYCTCCEHTHNVSVLFPPLLSIWLDDLGYGIKILSLEHFIAITNQHHITPQVIKLCQSVTFKCFCWHATAFS